MAVFIEKSFADECATGSVRSFISAQFRRKLFRKLAVFSDGSVESYSPSVDSNNDIAASTKSVTLKDAGPKKLNRRGSEWEILEGLKDGQRFERKPDVFFGYLMKKRKFPLKGWHKRYFMVDKGILVYGKSPGDVARGKIHGQLDIGLSVISAKLKRRRLDIDAEEFIYHLKAKTVESFQEWVEQLKVHRLYRQHVLTFGCGRGDRLAAEPKSVNKNRSKLTTTELASSVKACSPPPGMPRLAAWIIDSASPLDQASKRLNQVEKNLQQLSLVLDQIELASATDSELGQNNLADGLSPNVKKDRKKFGLRKKKSSGGSWGGSKNSHCSIDLSNNALPPPGSSPNKNFEPSDASPISTCSFSGGLSTSPASNNLSSSNPTLCTLTRPHSLSTCSERDVPIVDYKSSSESQSHGDFLALAKDVNECLKSVLYTLNNEKDRLKSALESETNIGSNSSSAVLSSLRSILSQTQQQNVELRARLNKIHEVADVSDLTEPKPLRPSLSYSSSCISQNEQFFDAEEYLNNTGPDTDIVERCASGVVETQGSDTSSEAGSISSEEGSLSSENSELAPSHYNAHNNIDGSVSTNMTGRRTKLPCPRPNTEGLSLWNLLCKNIGKDLSQVSMPVALNEPLNMLQRMCEELEYSELLDKAAELTDPYERMVHVAAFAVSSYGSSYYRAGSKPFNPLLGETYECVREDKGFKFVAEQVSHHPPVSVCHADSRNFIFWQDVRIKTKFWGKSMEFQPNGFINVRLLKPDQKDHYRWNKVTTCVHNLFSGQRWVDQYGELKIVNVDKNITCKLTFVKASYWSAKRHEVHGVVIDENEGKVVRKLFGKWSEALYCGVAPSAKCIWRQGTMPEDYELYYGFTRFAIELNELDAESAKILPVTDTRFRPDQRLLEEGDLDGAEKLKLQLEQAQRDRRKRFEELGIHHEPKWFKRDEDNEESWDFTNKYWEVRKNPGFQNISLEALW
ncbi:oxysterol-binding protein-related protein 6 isoform X2 [Bemisia tabaci]|uniref:oxysterol-binding protein-related protein 6 isoform X2 n=1 Tax=Bemisia tabaci TaxID=7038 RepID=UPI003B2851D3